MISLPNLKQTEPWIKIFVIINDKKLLLEHYNSFDCQLQTVPRIGETIRYESLNLKVTDVIYQVGKTQTIIMVENMLPNT